MLELSSKIARGEVSWVTRLRDGLGITRSRLSGLFTDRTVDPALLEEIETALLASDAGAEATRFLLAALRERAGRVETGEQLKSALRGNARRAARAARAGARSIRQETAHHHAPRSQRSG